MTNWRTKKLGDVMDFIPTGSHSRNDMTIATGDEEEVLNIHYGDIHTKYSTYVDCEEDSVPALKDNNIRAQMLLKDGDLVVADASEDYDGVGSSIELRNVSERKVIGGLHTFALRSKNDEFTSGFTGLILKNPATHKRLMQMSVYSKVYGLTKSSIASVDVSYPEKPEQKRIVGILEVWDEYIEKLEQKIALKEQLKKGLMQQLLTGKRRLPGFSREWRDYKMNELGNTYSGLAGKTKDDFGSGEPFITYMNIYSNPVLNTKNMQLVRIGENERQSIAEHGDIFFTTSSETPDEVGISSVLLDKSDQNIYLNSFCFGFRMHNLGTLEPRFAAYYFRSSIFRKKMTRIAQGASRYNLSKKYFMETEIRVPELDEQLAIVVLLENIDKQIAVHSVQYKNLKFQKKYLLKKLITGTIRTPEDLQPLDSSRLERSTL